MQQVTSAGEVRTYGLVNVLVFIKARVTYFCKYVPFSK